MTYALCVCVAHFYWSFSADGVFYYSVIFSGAHSGAVDPDPDSISFNVSQNK